MGKSCPCWDHGGAGIPECDRAPRTRGSDCVRNRRGSAGGAGSAEAIRRENLGCGRLGGKTHPGASAHLFGRSVALFLISRTQRTLGFGNRQQGWIKLDERGVNRAVLFMARIAGGRGRRHLSSLGVIESEKCPLAGE